MLSPPNGLFIDLRNLLNYFRFHCASRLTVSRQSDDTKICVVMVGLPARGKSLIAGKGWWFYSDFEQRTYIH